MKLSVIIFVALTWMISYAAESNYLINGDFSVQTKKNLPESWAVEGANPILIQEGKSMILKISTENRYSKNIVSFRQKIPNVPGGLYTFSGEIKGNVTQIFMVASFPKEVQEKVSFSRGTFLSEASDWKTFNIQLIVPDKSPWTALIIQPVSANVNDELHIRSLKLIRKETPALSVSSPSKKSGTPLPEKQGLSRQDQFFLPKDLYAVPGLESNIYYKNIFLTLNYANYTFEVESPIGRNDSDRWRYIPQPSDAGKTFPLTITVKDQDGIVAKGSTIVRVASADAGKGRAISLLMVGDSLTEQNIFPARVRALFDADKGITLTMIGTGTDGKTPGMAHEGYGGWTWESFLVLSQDRNQKENPHYRFNEPSKFLQKKDNSYIFDFAAFLKQYNNGKEPDFITFQLGVNDIFSETDANRNFRIAQILENADKLLAAFRRQAPDAVFGVGFVTPCASSQDAFGIHYKNGQTAWGFSQNQFRLNQAIAAHFEKSHDKKLFLLPMQVNLDRDHNFPIQEENVNSGNPAKIIRQSNGVHPAPAGYNQLGDSLYMWLKYQLSQKK